MNENIVNIKKKVLFSAYSLNIGGTETALVSLLNFLAKTNKYELTLVLEKKQGALLKDLNENINIIEYTPNYSKVKVFSRCINALKRIKFIIKYKNKFDASFAYSTYCKMASATSQIASKNSNLWVHSSYLSIFNNNEDTYKKFFNELKVNKFANIVCVSNKCKDEFESIMKLKNAVVCNNILDYEKIENLADESIELNKNEEFTFLYVGRITEDSKKISRLLEAANILINKGLKFKILIIGNGRDLEKSQEYVKKNNLTKYIYFLGELSNPYPYFKISDALILVSENEGYPVVYNEAKVLELPIITTDVSDSKIDIDNRYGIVCKQDLNDIVKNMEKVINKEIDFKNIVKEKFNAKQYNKEIEETLTRIICS